MDETSRLLPRNQFTADHRRILGILNEFVNDDRSTFLCHRSKLLERISHFQTSRKSIYTAELWTLVEQRWTSTKSRPFEERQNLTNRPIGDLYRDYEHPPPRHSVLRQPDLSISKPLDETLHKETCAVCAVQRQTSCQRCRGTTFILVWNELNIKWSNIHSRIQFVPDDSRDLLVLISEETLIKVNCLDFDDVWSEKEKSINSILNRCTELPAEFCGKINEKYFREHYQKAAKINRLRCLIERFDITECRYTVDEYPNRVFTFHLLGVNEKICIHQNSFPTAAEQCRAICSIL